MLRILLPSILFMLLAGCSTNPQVSPTVNAHNNDYFDHNQTSRAFKMVYQDWKGAPYRLGGNDRNGVDCSAFVQIAFRDAMSINLPRTTLTQSKVGHSIRYNDARSGDLIFFKTSTKTRHVGVYLGNRAFMHASTSKGVIVSRTDNPYWAAHFWHFRRVSML